MKRLLQEKKHMPYLGWIYNDDIQQECVGINYCAVDMLNALPTDKQYILLIADNSDYDFIFILEYLENVKPIVKKEGVSYKLKRHTTTQCNATNKDNHKI